MNLIEPSATLLWITPHPETIIESAGRTCYKSESNITEDSSEKFIKRIIMSGHESVLEHCSASFRIVCARFTTHQIVRHRLFSYSQESQRYCNYSKDKFNNEICFVRPMDLDGASEPLQLEWSNACRAAEISYFSLINDGVAPQCARSVLPSSCKTEIVMTGNFRSWRNFLHLRLSSHAQADIRVIAQEIEYKLNEQAPNVFPRTNQKEVGEFVMGLSLDQWIAEKKKLAEPEISEKCHHLQHKKHEEPKSVISEVQDFISMKSSMTDKNDHSRLRHNRSQYGGFKIGHYIQTPPMIFTQDGHNVFLGDMYRGASAFLVLGGPSILDLNLDALRQPGILTMGINNAVRTFRPNLWMCVDNPQNFILSTWVDPTITKFVPYAHAEKKLFDSNLWKESDLTVGQCPNVFYYRRNEQFQAEQYLFEDTFNWGNHSNLCHCGHWRADTKKNPKAKKETVCSECGKKAFGSRSVFLPAIRMMYFLGVRNLFLIGCDFKMELGKKNYHFEQDRSSGSVNGNNGSYRALARRLEELKPIFERMGFSVFNCNPNSHLDVFPKVSFKDAIDVALAPMPNIEDERTSGLYDRRAKK